jgi:hypothetical protein
MTMSVDDLVLAIQRAIDRLFRRLRRGASPTPTHRRFLIVQIDGLSRVALEEGLASGRMPFLARLLGRHGCRLEPMAVGMPTSTPAFQMAAMYGIHPDIPGFHYYDRERRANIHFPRPGHAALVEARQASGRRGILAGGSAYGCVFTGGADNNLFSFARLTRPTGRGIVFIPEVGAHAGPSPEELHAFIVRPATVTLPGPLTHPTQLYDHFMGYQTAFVRSASRREAR